MKKDSSFINDSNQRHSNEINTVRTQIVSACDDGYVSGESINFCF